MLALPGLERGAVCSFSARFGIWDSEAIRSTAGLAVYIYIYVRAYRAFVRLKGVI